MIKYNLLWVLMLTMFGVWNTLYAQVETDSVIQNQVELLVSRSDEDHDFV